MTDATDILRAATLRVLRAVLELQHAGARLTVRAVMGKAGLRGVNAVHGQLHRLRAAGLVHYVDGAHGTLRATCRVERVEGMGKGEA